METTDSNYVKEYQDKVNAIIKSMLFVNDQGLPALNGKLTILDNEGNSHPFTIREIQYFIDSINGISRTDPLTAALSLCELDKENIYKNRVCNKYTLSYHNETQSLQLNFTLIHKATIPNTEQYDPTIIAPPTDHEYVIPNFTIYKQLILSGVIAKQSEEFKDHLHFFGKDYTFSYGDGEFIIDYLE